MPSKRGLYDFLVRTTAEQGPLSIPRDLYDNDRFITDTGAYARVKLNSEPCVGSQRRSRLSEPFGPPYAVRRNISHPRTLC
jgi:hypothetical protein